MVQRYPINVVDLGPKTLVGRQIKARDGRVEVPELDRLRPKHLQRTVAEGLFGCWFVSQFGWRGEARTPGPVPLAAASQ